MKAVVDSTKCQAYGTCADVCPSVFVLDEWGFAGVQSDGVVPTSDETAARQAAVDCPEAAISLID